ncbi:MAG: hypothetical protein HYS24_07570 [Ignavibacteriales bacterium]|jgi:hypothetical protein|nr:hypothetical protein [Ignavibacteriales bacterium]
MKKIDLLISIIIFFSLISACGSEHKSDDKSGVGMGVKNDHEHKINDIHSSDSELIRNGIIDLSTIDENKNDSLYECPMDWNVLSDNDGDCPTCGMKLKEFKIEDVKANLSKHSFEYK